MSPSTHNIEDLESLLVTLQNSLGVVAPDEQRAELIERIEPLLVAHQLDSLTALATCIKDNQAENIRAEILDALSRSQSSWNLDPENKALLHEYVFSQLPADARVWIVGCGNGQLAYSVMMELAVYEHNNGVSKNFEIIATDVSQENIRFAESAIYSKKQLKDLPDDFRKLFIVPNGEGGGGQVKDKIRQRLSFRQCDLHEDTQSVEAVDLIICPEVLAYYSNDMKGEILHQLAAQLKSGGILLPGNNQSIMFRGNAFERVEHPAGVFYRQKN